MIRSTAVRAEPAAPVSGHGAGSAGRLAAAQLSTHNNFDLVRLGAATQVAILHAAVLLGLPLWAPLRYVLLAIPGVPIFFVTSGFLLAGSLERDPNLRRYSVNRALRIYPALWLCFAVTLVVLAQSGVLTAGLLFSVRGAAWVVGQLTFAKTNPAQIHKYATGTPNGALWTISVEIGFYVVLGVLWILVRNMRRQWADLMLAAIALLSFVIAIKTGTDSGAATATTHMGKLLQASPLPYLWIFFIGVLARRRWDWIRPLVMGRAWLWIPVAVVGYHLLPGVSGRPSGAQWLGLGADRVLLGFAAVSAAYTMPALADKALRRIDISYGLYLYHFVWINVVFQAGHTGSWRWGTAAILAAVVSAAVSWFLVERRALRLKARPATAP